jgi:hypothetical protein
MGKAGQTGLALRKCTRISLVPIPSVLLFLQGFAKASSVRSEDCILLVSYSRWMK